MTPQEVLRPQKTPKTPSECDSILFRYIWLKTLNENLNDFQNYLKLLIITSVNSLSFLHLAL